MDTPINNGGPAFPFPVSVYPSGQVQPGCYGMSLRDWFAGQALAGLCSRDLQGAGEYSLSLNNHINHANVRRFSEPTHVAKEAVAHAEALIAELSEGVTK